MEFNYSYIGLRPDLLKYIIREDINVLDVGCATGSNGEWLKNNKKIKYLAGIELDNKMAAIAKPFYDEMIVGNLDSLDLDKALNKRKFDYILLGDILEHLIDPDKTLSQLSERLSTDGKIIISLPNIQHINTFINLYIKGKWAYNERGIYDKTHLRWFTLKNIREMVHSSNLKIVKIERKYRFMDAVGSKFPLGSRIVLTRLFRNLFTFQYVIVCSL
jgi:2-polyprenyl-3-methyl-5-hydroxy-6-metoxy-1,4-benzoquinol methylase